MPLCARCGTENPDIAKFCLACGTPLESAPAPQEVRKVVTIVFSDLKGSTAMGEQLDSESLREVMTRYFDAMRVELEAHGGVVEKFIGDAIMAVFGLPRLHEDDALRAVRAAAGMQRALARVNDELERHWGVRLTVRTGVNTGEVVAGDPTAGQRLVTGDTVNVAARLEQSAGAQEVLLGDLTYRLVRDYVEVEPVEPLELKGKAEPVPAYRLVSVIEGAERPRRMDAPMIGRDDELGLLKDALAWAVSDRRCHLATIVGEAGFGKSRLVDEFIRSLTGNATVLRGRCLPYGDGITFWPLAEAVRQASGIAERDAMEVAHSKLCALVRNDHVVERVAAAIGLSSTSFAVHELLWGARKLLESLAGEQPVVVVFDDIHWAEATFLELIEHVLEAAEAPILLVCPTRRELIERRPDWSTGERATRIELQPLTEDQAGEVARHLLGQTGLDDDVRRRVIAAAEGNPLFVEQLLSMLIDQGLIRFQDGGWRATERIDRVSVPPTIQALLAARLEELEPDERAVIEPAAVIGHSFVRDAVAFLTSDAVRPRVDAHLDTLSYKQFIRSDRSDEEAYRFQHILIRDTTYDGVLKRARATLHERFVEWADSVNREGAVEYEEILGYHLEQAHRYLSELGPLEDHGRGIGADASRRLAAAGRRALVRGDMAAAVNLLERAAALLDERSDERLELLVDLSEAVKDVGDFQRARALLEEVDEAARERRDERLAAHATVGSLLLDRYAGDSAWAARVTAASPPIISTLEEAGDHAGLAKLYRLEVILHGTAFQFSRFEAAVERYLERARLAANQQMQTHAATATAIAALFGPTRVDEAIVRCNEALRVAEGNKRAEALVMTHLAQLHAMEGNFERARELYSSARGTLEDLGVAVMANATSIDSGPIEILAGNPVRAESELRRDYEVLNALGETYFTASIAHFLAEALEAQDRDEEADAFAGIAHGLSEEDDVATEAAWRSVRAVLFAKRGDHETGLELAEEAVRLMESTDAPIWRANAARDYARVLAYAGRIAKAESAYRDALELYERKGSRVAALRVTDALERLSQEARPLSRT
jgi:class 3 adenylate cyclase/tetratricopeptide (TPR) repeat protein